MELDQLSSAEFGWSKAGARSKEQGARSKEQGARSKEESAGVSRSHRSQQESARAELVGSGQRRGCPVES